MSDAEKEAKDKAAELAAEERAKLLKVAESEVEEKNKPLTGKGLRWTAGMTRGKNPTIIQYQHFDETLPDTLPENAKEFVELTGIQDEKKIMEFWIAGFNDEKYRLASDELNEFIESHWSDETITQFRFAVRNAVKLSKKPLETVVKAIKSMME